MGSLTAENSIEIKAPAAKVWEVLVKPDFIRQWDEVPEGYGEAPLNMGSEMAWESEGGKIVKLVVIEYEPLELLQLSLFNTSWAVQPAAGEITYTYTLAEKDGSTLLSIQVGDFSILPEGQDYYDASQEFVKDAATKIKQLAETGSGKARRT
jgi:uncharacterized protein YndB with AHSA1/START domain